MMMYILSYSAFVAQFAQMHTRQLYRPACSRETTKEEVRKGVIETDEKAERLEKKKRQFVDDVGRVGE